MSEQKATSTITILAVDDEPVNLATITNLLKEFGHDVLVANSGEKALAVISDRQPDLILLDIHMPGISGIDVCRSVKGNSKTERVPILFLTSSESDIEEAFDAGGVDYILKPFRTNELISRVNTHLKMSSLMCSLEQANTSLEILNQNLEGKVRDRTQELLTANASLRKEISERRQLEDKVAYLSRYDFVTRMFNQSSMKEQLAAKLIEYHKNRNINFFFLYLDLDQFRVINDTCGHAAGDELLRQIAELISSLLDDGDIVARMGGDEFAILFESTGIDAATVKAKNVKTAIEEFPFHWEEESFRINSSIGLIEIDDSFYDVNQLIGIAERTCFELKSKGGGELAIYNISKSHINRSKEQVRWVPIIQRAVDNNEFFLCGQYITEIATAKVKKVEVLIRLETFGQKVLPPGHFIPIAERYHLITSVDKWVISTAIKQSKLINAEYQISINVSGESICKDSFVDYVEDLVKESDLEPSKICFEITETSALSNIQETKKFIGRLKSLGCQFALDDFGTGTSSYGYLKELAVDFLKIDGLFVRDIETEKINRMMVESVTSIAKEMNIKVIAECVENQEALDVLEKIGVDYVQGFYLHKPTRLEEL